MLKVSYSLLPQSSIRSVLPFFKDEDACIKQLVPNTEENQKILQEMTKMCCQGLDYSSVDAWEV